MTTTKAALAAITAQVQEQADKAQEHVRRETHNARSRISYAFLRRKDRVQLVLNNLGSK